MSLENVLNSLREIDLFDSEQEMVLITDEPKIPGYLCFANDEAKRLFQTKDTTGQGFDIDRTKARVKAVGEFLERLCLFNLNQNLLRIDRFRADDGFMNPRLFGSSPFQEMDISLENQEYRWINAIDILNNRSCLIPAQLVFLSSVFDEEHQIRSERITTGAAFGPADSDFAFRSGLLETIERDACISSYLMRKSLRRIVDFPKEIQSLFDYIARYNLEPLVFDATTDLNVPTALVITLDKTGIGAAVNVGSASAFTYKEAVSRAILESVQCRRQGRLMEKADFPKRNFPKENEVNSMEDRFYYWRSLERISNLGFWIDNPSFVRFSELTASDTTFDSVLKTLKDRGYHLFVADASLPQIKTKGYQVVKVVIPELHPLYLDERAKTLYSVHYGKIKEDTTLKPHPLT